MDSSSRPRPGPTKPCFGELVRVRGGWFSRGSDDPEAEEDERPAHTVELDDFFLGATPVTVAEFRAFIESSRYRTDAEKGESPFGRDAQRSLHPIPGLTWRVGADGQPARDDHPVVCVSWNDAFAYCEWCAKELARPVRLPSEAEWEYAAGNGARHTRYSWGDGEPLGRLGGNVADVSVLRFFAEQYVETFQDYDDGFVFTSPVRSFAPNDFGLFDMTGNVSEWCRDWYGSSYPGYDPSGPRSGEFRVFRDGGWMGRPWSCRVSARFFGAPERSSTTGGFRVACDA
jgi:formylglycine-generating enzyme required for sulfatase activity